MNDMEQYEREMLMKDQRGSNEIIPKKEMNDLKNAYKMLDEMLSNPTVFIIARDNGLLRHVVERTRSIVGKQIFDYENSPYIDIE
jgi:hypothetical protein|tara:strand:- start:5245 stop:5499 length:255 start_codon:yes stop_codon:yes gene_type:complete